jgi:hypothetical protein
MFYKIILNPVIVYLLIWTFFIVGNLFGIMQYPKKVDQFYNIIFLSLVSLFFGFALVKIIFYKKIINVRKKKKILLFLKKRISILKKVYSVFIIISLAGLILTYIKLFSQVSFDFFIHNQATIKTDIDRSVLGAHLCSFAYIDFIIGILISKITDKKTYWLIPILMIILFSFSFFGRVPIFIALIMGYFMHTIIDYLYNKKKNIIKFFSLIILFIFLSFSFLSLTINERIAEYGITYDPYRDFISNDTKIFFNNYDFIFGSDRSASITYAYLFNPIATLNYWASNTFELGYGKHSFPYIYRIMVKLGVIDNKDNFIGNNETVGEMGLQLPTYLGSLYEDFGYFGVLLFPFLISFISTYLYYKLIYYNNIYSILILPILLTFIVFSPLIFMFMDVVVFDVLVVVILLSIYLNIKYIR